MRSGQFDLNASWSSITRNGASTLPAPARAKRPSPTQRSRISSWLKPRSLPKPLLPRRIILPRKAKKILAEGGTAIEAMLAMATTIAVVYPHMDRARGRRLLAHSRTFPARFTTSKPAAMPARKRSWRAIAILTTRSYRSADHSPRQPSPARSAAMPWRMTLPRPAGRACRLPISCATPGSLPKTAIPSRPASPRLCRSNWLRLKTPFFAESFLVDGGIAPAGTVQEGPKLAAMIEHLGEAGLDDFYRGDIGREIAADMQRIGVPAIRCRSQNYRAVLRTPLSLALEGRRHFNSPPPTRSRIALYVGAFRPLQRHQGRKLWTYSRSHRSLETRFGPARSCLDRLRLSHPRSDRFSETRRSQSRGASIRFDRAAPYPLAPSNGDTIWMGAIDAEGRTVSFIQSIYWEYGSGCVLPQTGILLQNRGCSFSLDPTSLNPLTPSGLSAAASSIPLWPLSTTAKSWRMARWAVTVSRNSRPKFSRGMCWGPRWPPRSMHRAFFGKLWGAEIRDAQTRRAFRRHFDQKAAERRTWRRNRTGPFRPEFGRAGRARPPSQRTRRSSPWSALRRRQRRILMETPNEKLICLWPQKIIQMKDNATVVARLALTHTWGEPRPNSSLGRYQMQEIGMQNNTKTSTSNRGFASMDADKQREIARKGGRSVPNEKRSFSQNHQLASEAGRKGGHSSHGSRTATSREGWHGLFRRFIRSGAAAHMFRRAGRRRRTWVHHLLRASLLISLVWSSDRHERWPPCAGFGRELMVLRKAALARAYALSALAAGFRGKAGVYAKSCAFHGVRFHRLCGRWRLFFRIHRCETAGDVLWGTSVGLVIHHLS